MKPLSDKELAIRFLNDVFAFVGYPKYSLRLTDDQNTTLLLWEGPVKGPDDRTFMLEGSLALTEGSDGFIHEVRSYLRPLQVGVLLKSTIYVRHDPDSPQVRSREDYRQYLTGLCTIFPDLHFTVEDVMAEGDKVTCWFSIRGTHSTPWRGLPATGKQVMVTGINISRIVESKVVEDWFNTDIFSLAMQLGAIPAPK